ncbi:hypothetical protein AL755_13815 [Arthrobacter sp. ERGS1:01]|uniref:hypothetical protein n=1 Tax=Arthrobacter sp. ERGS1:01 TaxID=1704044 RepID=UPI0006B4C1E6|nr:hypothetical protein [Arthrobacter sp. ERGS1:01]ALE06287.1 hypothetical protein AL755_13815 [Arthrobacter sp. ERGS1:01]
MTTNFTPIRPEAAGKTWALQRTALAGFGFTLSWLIGLSVFAASTTVVSTGAEIIAAYRGRAAAGVLQYLFTEGLPPVAILVVVGALARWARGAGYRRLAKATWVAALVASIISFAQFVFGVVLVTVAVPAGDAAISALLSDSVTRLDGAKMLLFAGMAITTFVYLARAQHGQLLWLRIVSLLLAVTITVSGLGYLFMVTSLATAADASLPLLLVWVTGFAIVLGRRGH